MLLYKRNTSSLLVVATGSPFLSTVVLPILAAALSLFLENYWVLDDNDLIFLHPYPFQLFSALVGFGLVFRANLAYARYWEGRTCLASLGSKWTDAALQIRTFISVLRNDVRGNSSFKIISSSPPFPALTAAALKKRMVAKKACDEAIHLLSLAHALTLQQLRGDNNLTSFKNIVDDNAHRHKPPSMDITDGLSQRRRLKNMFTSSANNSDARYLHAVFRGSKLGVIGGIRTLEISHLYKKTSTGNSRISFILERLMKLIAEALEEGVIDAPPPIVSRIYQVLSEGHERGVMMARKIAETPFPLPFAQIIEILVIFFVATLPFILSAWLRSSWAVGAGTFMTAWCYLALNEVSRMLEEPFGGDANDLPLPYLQWEFNRRIEGEGYDDGDDGEDDGGEDDDEDNDEAEDEDGGMGYEVQKISGRKL